MNLHLINLKYYFRILKDKKDVQLSITSKPLLEMTNRLMKDKN